MKQNRLALLVLAVLVVGVPVSGRQTEKPEGDLAKMQGIWSVVSVSEDGRPFPKPEEFKFQFKDNKILILSKGVTDREMTCTLDPSKSPREINLSRTVDGQVETAQGIYEMSGDSFKMCLIKPGQGARPKEFKSPNKDILLLELKRDKP
jgi:uncharacterized protein (TIGR03067 family)